MDRFEELDALTSRELHDRAIRYARHHLDARFFWHMLSTVPAAQAAAGNLEEADENIEHAALLIGDAIDEDDGALLDSMRPFFIDYLQSHPKA